MVQGTYRFSKAIKKVISQKKLEGQAFVVLLLMAYSVIIRFQSWLENQDSMYPEDFIM